MLLSLHLLVAFLTELAFAYLRFVLVSYELVVSLLTQPHHLFIADTFVLQAPIALLGIPFLALLLFLGTGELVKDKLSGLDHRFLTSEGAFNRSLLMGRMLWLTGAIAYLLFGWGYNFWSQASPEPLSWRFGVSVILLTFLISSYFSSIFRKHVVWISATALSILQAHALAMVWMSAMEPAYVMVWLILCMGGLTILHQVRSFVIYSSILLLVSTLVVWQLKAPQFSPILFISMTAAMLACCLVVLLVWLNFSSKLELSDKILQNITSLILVSNSMGEIVFVSPNVKHILGYTQEELIGQGWWKMRAKDNDYNETLKGEVIDIATGRSQLTGIPYNAKFTKKNGDPIWMQFVDNTLPGGLAVGVGQDVTERKQIENEMKQLSVVASQTNNAIIITDAKARVEWVNEGFRALTGYSMKEVRGKRTFEMMGEEALSSDQFKKIMRQFAKQKPFVQELKDYTKEGKPYWASLNVTPIFDKKGKAKKFIIIAIDITEKTKSQQQLRSYSLRLELLHQVDSAILNHQGIEEMLGEVLDHLHGHLSHSNSLSVFLFDEPRHRAKVLYWYGSKASQLKTGTQISLDDLKSYPFLKQHKVFKVANLEQEATLSVSDLENLKNQTKSYLAVPLFVESQLIGSFNLGSRKVDGFSAEEITLAEEVASSLAVAIHQKNLEDQIRQKNQDITDSISYAKRIQQANLPDLSQLAERFEHFVYEQPKHIVSGDFYWFATVEDRVIVAVADCTGHGVPGAFLTMMGINLLNQIIRDQQLCHPSTILQELNNRIGTTLSSGHQHNRIDDGMDIAICTIDPTNKTIQYAGAYRPLLLLQRDEFTEIKGNRGSIGDVVNGLVRQVTFEEHTVSYESGDRLYLFSDGLTDQFGGEDKKKFTIKRLRELLLNNRNIPITQQHHLIEASLHHWMNGGEQVDDILVMGIAL